MGICGVDSKAKCFEGSCWFVVWEVMLELFTHVAGGGVGYSFVEVDDLASESIKSCTLFVRFFEVVGGRC